MHHAYASVTACRPASSPVCENAVIDFDGAYSPSTDTVATLLHVVPALIGAFIGAPVLAREFETGTFRYAWTLGFGRRRWTIAKLVPLAVTVTAATEALSTLFSWYYQPIFGLGLRTPLNPEAFDLRGVAFAAWTLAAFASGALASAVIRRVVPAMAATLAAYAGLAFGTGLYLRQHYATPLVTGNLNVPDNAWIMSQWWTKGGAPVDPTTMDRVITATLERIAPVITDKSQKQPTFQRILQYLTQNGYTRWTSYQPGSRFWPFQWTEAGWLLALSALLITATIARVHRKAV